MKKYQSFMSPKEQALKYSRDLKNVINTARADGYKEGLEMARQERREEGISLGKDKKEKQMIITLQQAGVELSIISQITGLSIDEIQEILDEINE